METNHSSKISNIVINNLKPKKIFPDNWASLRVVIALFISLLIGVLLKNSELQALLVVGTFLEGILVLLPHHSNRAVVGISTSILLILSFFIGSILYQHEIIVYIIFFILIFISGLLRKINVLVSIRALIISIFVLGSSQLTVNHQMGMLLTASISVGILIVLVCQLLPPYINKFTAQRKFVANIFSELGKDASLLISKKRNTSSYLTAIQETRHLLNNLDYRSKNNIDFLFNLVSKAEIMEDYFNLIHNKNLNELQINNLNEISKLLINISFKLKDSKNKDFTFQHEFKEITKLLVQCNFDVDLAFKNILNEEINLSNVEEKNKNIIKSVLNELNFKSPIFIQAVRLAIFTMIAAIIGDLLTLIPVISMPDHGFWVPLTTAIILFPDYIDVFSKGIERSLGTIIGAILGVLLLFLPLGLIGHSILVFILLVGYIIFRFAGQFWIMFWITAWLCNIGVLTHVAIPRSIYTVAGAIVAIIACVIWPAWNTNKIDKLLSSWIKVQTKYLNAIINTSLSNKETAKLTAIRHKSNTIYQQLFMNINKASYEPVFEESKWNNENLAALMSVVTNMNYTISSLNIINKSDTDINEIITEVELSLEALSESILSKNPKPIQYIYNIENFNLDIENKNLNFQLKETLKSLISDIIKIEHIINILN
ncbi:FUSC family protein [uncultured Clostridium sp.]|uniref:FUSC family protein n=1 Tax=uncultured Clostridium sp. TaxID=59620 RepID=UPI00262C5FF9|nr:FUSC family protein [uncultured Clostridium sp.]